MSAPADPIPHPSPESQVSLRVPARTGEVKNIRVAIGRLGRRAGLDEERLADVALAVGEACANAVVHAYAEREPGVLRVRADLTAQGLRVIVADDGHGMALRPDSPGLGLGVPLMAALSSSLEFRTPEGGGTEACMIFATHGHAAGAAWSQTG